MCSYLQNNGIFRTLRHTKLRVKFATDTMFCSFQFHVVELSVDLLANFRTIYRKHSQNIFKTVAHHFTMELILHVLSKQFPRYCTLHDMLEFFEVDICVCVLLFGQGSKELCWICNLPLSTYCSSRINTFLPLFYWREIDEPQGLILFTTVRMLMTLAHPFNTSTFYLGIEALVELSIFFFCTS